GAVWFWFIDLFAVATLLFALTGLALMALHAKRRPATWPVTALGLIVPWLLIALFVH
ncbi:MAG: PepSY-associated TM helix domain-containing protein, partial [Pseudomonadota bacterium]|nr:PepSY-associated TM helix domain-containing protein [Pseudomonadota bacterium]